MKHCGYVVFYLLVMQGYLFGQLEPDKDQTKILKLFIALQIQIPNFFNTFFPYCLARYQRPSNSSGIRPSLIPLVDFLVKERDEGDICTILVRKSIEGAARRLLPPAMIKKIDICNTSRDDFNLRFRSLFVTSPYRCKIRKIIEKVRATC